jgi:uncharacterized protein
MQILFGWIGIILSVYLLIGCILYFIQERFIFRSKSLPSDYQFEFNVPFREKNLTLANHENLNIIQFFPGKENTKGVVLYFHGNRDNVTRYATHSEIFIKNKYEVWMIDFPGYGKTTGIRTEENFYTHALAAFHLATEKFKCDQIVLYGKSLGSGVASFLASQKKVERLILETPYFSMPDLLKYFAPIYPVHLMLRFKFPVGAYCKKTSSSITIFHGKKDRVIPYQCAKKIEKEFKPRDEFVTITSGNHHNLTKFREYCDKIAAILSA